MNLRIDHSEVVELRFHVALRGVEQLFRISNLFFQCCALLLQTFNALAAMSRSRGGEETQQTGGDAE